VDNDLTLDGLDFDQLGGSTSATEKSADSRVFRSEPVRELIAEVLLAPASVPDVAPERDEPMIFVADDVPEWACLLGVFDLETTGIDPETDRIVSAHVGLLDKSGSPVERSDWIADPGIEIPAGASAIHGISTERARAEGRPATEVVGEVLAALRAFAERGIPVVIYNAPYDLTLLLHEALRHGHEPLDETLTIIDPLVLDKAVDKYRKGKRTLTAASEYYGVVLTDAHEASSDAIAAGRVAQALARRYAAELWLSAAELHDLQVGWCREQTESFIEYMRRVKDPAFTTSSAWPVRARAVALQQLV
jgi:DNA polymerase-3 subunit epsilon